MVRIRLFDGVSATSDAGEPLSVGSARSQAVLAALALSPGSAVPVWRLVELAWADAPPENAEKALQWHVVQLRKGLGPNAIVRTGAAYRLDVEPEAIDVARFQRRLDEGDIDAALAEWTGTPLAGLDAQGLTATVAGLVERWLSAVEVNLERRVDLDAKATIGPLTELTARHPFREGLRALLMTALYRVGRQADALAAFRNARQHMVEQLGVEPGARLRELESAILGHDERLGARQNPERPMGTVTFGFMEVAGSTRLWARHRQKMAAAIGRLDELVRATTSSHDGFVFATGGESFGVAFHRADDGAAWALQLQAAVAGEPWSGGVELRVRIGLHTGATEEQAMGYFGPVVHAAARIAAAAHGGQILASAVTVSLLDRTGLRDLGSFRLDEVGGEQHIFQLDGNEHPPIQMAGDRRGNLPRRPGRLVGRDDDLKTIAEALEESPVVTLVGPGGIGKTRLALAAARTTEEAWLVDLAEISSSSDVPRAFADALDVTELAGRTLIQSIVTVLQARQALILIDNCEHVIDGAARLARAIAEGCSGVRMLATSRERLGIDGEQVVPVGPLDHAAGVELFDVRASAADRTFDRPAHRPEVEEICRRLDGIPLAIELVAARTRSLRPADLVARLDDRLRLVTGGSRAGAERHRTLRATIQWSYDLLTPAEQTLFQRLSVFAGPFDLAAAEAIGTGVGVDDLMGGLVERSMVLAESGPFGRRFRLLETMRQFGAELLPATDQVAGRHARWSLGEVNDIHRLLTGPAEIEGVARLGELWPNLRAAVDWACATGADDLARALVRPIATEVALRGRHEVADWAERILAMTPSDAFWFVWIAERNTQNGDRAAFANIVRRHGLPDHALARYAQAYLSGDGEALHRHLPEAAGELPEDLAAFLHMMSAGTLIGIGRFQDVDASISALADRYRAQGPPTLLHWALQTLAYSAAFQGRHNEADQLFDEAATVDVPDRTLSAGKLVQARSLFRRGQHPRALHLLRSYIEEQLETENVIAASVIAIEFVAMMAALDRLTEAAHILAYLKTANDFGALATRTLLAEAGKKMTSPAVSSLNDRQALAYMRDALEGSA